MSNAPFLYPNVTGVPGNRTTVDRNEGPDKKPGSAPSEFDQVLKGTLDQSKAPSSASEVQSAKDLGQLKQPLKFSAHATQRLKERGIHLDTDTLLKVNDALDKAEAKGLEDTLVLTKDAALIVNIPNRTVITAMDKGSLTGNVFTNIDGAVIVS